MLLHNSWYVTNYGFAPVPYARSDVIMYTIEVVRYICNCSVLWYFCRMNFVDCRIKSIFYVNIFCTGFFCRQSTKYLGCSWVKVTDIGPKWASARHSITVMRGYYTVPYGTKPSNYQSCNFRKHTSCTVRISVIIWCIVANERYSTVPYHPLKIVEDKTQFSLVDNNRYHSISFQKHIPEIAT